MLEEKGLEKSCSEVVTLGLGLALSTGKEIAWTHSVQTTIINDLQVSESYHMSFSLGVMLRSPRGLELGLEYIELKAKDLKGSCFDRFHKMG